MDSKILIPAIILVIVFVCAAAIEAPKRVEFKNLKVLPRDISEKALQDIMEIDCSKGLGVSCDYCHIKKAASDEMDFASDAKSEKEVARSMMRMTLEINQKYFGMAKPMIGDTLMTISCRSCHQGEAYPPRKR